MELISFFLENPYTLRKGTHVANFSILTLKQTKHVRSGNPTLVRQLPNNNHDDAIHFTFSFLELFLPDEVTETYRFAAPQQLASGKEHKPIPPIQTRILNK